MRVNLSSPLLCPLCSLHADWLLLWPRLRGVPTRSQGAGRGYQHTLGSHWQVLLVIVRQAGHRRSKRLLTPMIWVRFKPTPRTCFQATVVPALVQGMTSSKRVIDKAFADRWSLDLIMSICRSQPRQMCTLLLGNDHYQSRTPLLKAGESLDIPVRLFAMQFNKIPSL